MRIVLPTKALVGLGPLGPRLTWPSWVLAHFGPRRMAHLGLAPLQEWRGGELAYTAVENVCKPIDIVSIKISYLEASISHIV